ncbi:TorCAD operon transcriptional regulatory protein TorR [Aminobacter sp. MSH1]|uniref:hypothetical protein n=1 Tax=Aminobacter sp. MSH1 TaxID=374606 RepID=UPI000D505667|nr:hypothetical protein [Aminobacter sp. MSH1]AWC21703.1 TorCAD operon transcriptional regulatory protein TorR [Aminobacter sp. MSH1]
MRVQHHIVIVEDDPVTRAKLAGYFLAEGYKVSEAGDGEQCAPSWAGIRRTC